MPHLNPHYQRLAEKLDRFLEENRADIEWVIANDPRFEHMRDSQSLPVDASQSTNGLANETEKLAPDESQREKSSNSEQAVD